MASTRHHVISLAAYDSETDSYENSADDDSGDDEIESTTIIATMETTVKSLLLLFKNLFPVRIIIFMKSKRELVIPKNVKG